MELGPIQKQWIADLRTYPERQYTNRLGILQPGGIVRLCCLGQGLVTLKGGVAEAFRIDETAIKDLTETFCLFDFNSSGFPESGELVGSYSLLGLRDMVGSFTEPFNFDGYNIYTLTDANDSGMSWSEIADFMEKNPEKVFVHSV